MGNRSDSDPDHVSNLDQVNPFIGTGFVAKS